MATSALTSSFLAQNAAMSSSNGVADSARLSHTPSQPRKSGRSRLSVKAASSGTKIAKQLKNLQVLAMGDKTGTLRSAITGEPPQVKLLAKVQELRLLSKAEQAGLLTLAENLGVSLTTIEQLGLLSKAESSGALSAAVNPQTPGALLTIALVLLLVGPAAVFLIPEDNLPEVVLQIVLAITCIAGGAAAFGGSKLVKALQEA